MQLHRLLGGDRQMLIALMDLQQMTRDDSDLRLVADILQRAQMIIRVLGLDPRSATAEEVYRALDASIADGRELLIDDWLIIELDDQLVSLNREDVIENYHHQLPFSERQVKSGQRGLGFEIMRRYKQHPVTHDKSVERVVCDGGICWIEPI